MTAAADSRNLPRRWEMAFVRKNRNQVITVISGGAPLPAAVRLPAV
jgi:hypothetical protein